MEQITNLSVDILKVHPRNTEFFDDIQGEQYEKFKNSIKEDGILTPLIVSPDMTIISGHQRYQAAKDLNIGLVPVIIKEELLDEKEKLKKLLATNFGRLKNDPVKQGRVFKEYEKLVGVKQGRPSKSRQIVVISQEEMAKELGVDVRTLQRLKKLNSLSPDLQELISDGTVKYTTALNVWGKLTNEDQSKLIEELGKDKIKEMKAKDTKEYIDKIRKLERALVEEKNKPPKIVTEVVDKTDYESISKLKCTIQDKEKELIGIKSQKKILEDRLECLEHDTEEYERLKDEISNLIETKTSLGKQIQGVKKTTELLYDVDKLLKMIAPAKYSQAIFDLKDDVVVLENLHTMIDLVQQWCVEFRGLLPQKETKTIYMEAEVIE
ncbi:ParB/RepB/Spo0J family partition protein [Clostridium thermobutyricum]|uniref:ParB/RepB/Spo0J family partition protein n=1 Tax=Clostridium thermobutyricum TaxID=29372 RepID=UPI0018AA637C|nr:ParB N-terminal domain-containing protein [Clostridium thermobutyricum]